MTSPHTDAPVPEDVMEAARKAYWAEDGEFAIASAIMAERERCAKVAETHNIQDNFEHPDGEAWYHHGKAIAAAIRNPRATE